jgi:hypothetical protein
MSHPPPKDIAVLMAALQNISFAHDLSVLDDIIGCSMQDAQHSREAAQQCGILKRFSHLGHLTVRELRALSLIK